VLLDAVLPHDKILRRFYPQVEVKADINARASPYTHTRQILEAPFGSRKLDSESNLELAWRYIMQEWLLAGRCDTLVICQVKAEKWLRARGLPDNVFVEHYYAISGIDKYKNVKLGILLGRPAPGPREIEEVAGALTGVQQVACLRQPNGFVWYPPQDRGIRLPNGEGRKTRGDLHPSPLGEAVRYQYCEGELINAYGRLRAILRDADNPCSIRLLFDTCLPITGRRGDDVATAEPCHRGGNRRLDPTPPRRPEGDVAGPVQDAEGGEMGTPEGRPTAPGFVSIRYQMADQRGRVGEPRLAYYDPKMIPDPKRLLRERLGRTLVFRDRSST
jgi:hypothetical protein